MNQLTDEQALAKANSIEWFDNQAGMIDFVKPKKKRVFTSNRATTPNLENMTVEQLQEQYILAQEQLSVIKDVPKELTKFVSDKSNKVFSYMLAVRQILRKKQSKEDNIMLDELFKLRESDAQVTIKNLNGKISQLTNELNQVRSSSISEKTKKKIQNIEDAKRREIMIHIKFKGVVKDYVGHDKYLTMIREADVLADAELNKGNP